MLFLALRNHADRDCSCSSFQTFHPASPENVSCAFASQLPFVLDRCVSFERWYVDAGGRAGLAGVAANELRVWWDSTRLWQPHPVFVLHWSEVCLPISSIDPFTALHQFVAGIAALGLAALIATGAVNRWMVLGFSFVTVVVWRSRVLRIWR